MQQPSATNSERMAEQDALRRILALRETQLALIADEYQKLAKQPTIHKHELEALDDQLRRAIADNHEAPKRMEAEVRKLEGRLRHQADQLNFVQSELALKTEEVRYQVGDAIVRAARSPLDFLKLPGRLASAFLRGRARAKERKRLESPALPTEARPPKHRNSATSSITVARGHADAQRTASSEISATPKCLSPQYKNAPIVAGILDTMSATTFGHECRLLRFSPHNWQRAMEMHRPAFLLVESAWHGNNDTWTNLIGEYSGHSDAPLRDLTDWCRKNDIPTVFWNKEDPVHFTRFSRAATMFDYVFTSDANMISDYRALCGSQVKHIGALTFSAQPAIHHPIATEPRVAAPCFAGSFYANRHSARRQQMEVLLDAALPFGLVIYDRNYGKASPDFQFPARFQSAINGSLPYEEVVDVYKRHKVFLNVNSVSESPTMFSRRVFELLACGTAVVSTPSVGISELFGDIVAIADRSDEFTRILEKLTTDDVYWRNQVRKGRRAAFAHHTTRHRLRQIAEAIGLDEFHVKKPQYVAFSRIESEPDIERLVSTIQRQTWKPVALLFAVDGGFSRDVVTARLQKGLPDRPVAAFSSTALNNFARQGNADWAAYFHPQAEYDTSYVEDLLLCSRFADADVIGHASYQYRDSNGALQRLTDVENAYANHVHPHAFAIRLNALERCGMNFHEYSAIECLARVEAIGARIYASDGEGVVMDRA